MSDVLFLCFHFIIMKLNIYYDLCLYSWMFFLQINSESNSIVDAQKISERIANVSGSLVYPICSGIDYREWDSKELIYLLPSTQRFVKLDSRYFYTSSQMKFNFQVIDKKSYAYLIILESNITIKNYRMVLIFKHKLNTIRVDIE